LLLSGQSVCSEYFHYFWRSSCLHSGQMSSGLLNTLM
jgi:hypothetical protein